MPCQSHRLVTVWQLRRAIMTMVVSGAYSLTTSPGAANAEGELADVRRAHQQWRGTIRSLAYSGEMTGWAAGTSNIRERKTRRRFAATGDWRFAEYQHLRHGLGWEDDTDWHRVYLGPDETALFWPLNGNAAIVAGPPDPADYPKLQQTMKDFYLRCSGWWPLDGSIPAKESVNEARMVCEVLDDQYTVVEPTTVEIDGRECIVVTNIAGESHDRLCLDYRRSFVLVKRELTTSEVHLTTDACDFIEVKGGIWLPIQVRQQVFRRELAGGAVLQNLRIADARLRLDNLTINSTTERDFVFSPEPGTLVRNWNNGEIRQVPGGHQVFDSILRTARNEVALRSRDSPASPRPDWFAVMLLAVICVATACMIHKRFRHAKASRC
jgi:hypothetical protein